MARRSKAKKNRTGTIPTDSFSDIAFLLIIYLLVATTLVKLQAITADLPSGEKAEKAQSEKTPIVNLRGGQMFFNDKPVEMAGLEERLAALEFPTKDPEKRVVMLETARGTPYDAYFQALAAISGSGGVVALVDEEK